jgi:predicted acetyltransferase
MTIEIRPALLESFEDYVKADFTAFGEHVRPEELEAVQKVFEPDRSLAAYDGSRIVGTTSTASMSLTVPGGDLPMAGVTGVGVAPTHRRRGILTDMMRRQLDDTRDAEEAIAGLWASESLIYGRFGYGMAAFATSFELTRHHSRFSRPFEDRGRIRLADKEEALELLPGIFERFRPGQPGAWSRSQSWWEHLLADLEHWRDGASALWFAIHETDGVPDGYATYRIKHEWGQGASDSRLKVRDLVAENDEAYAALWRYCCDVDLMARVEAWPRGIDEPLFHMLADPRHLNVRVFDGLWLRIVDVPAALTGRGYRAEGRIVLEVLDAFCPSLGGRFELEAGPGGAQCRPTSLEPDMTMWASDLGAVYLGGVRFSTLARATRVKEEHGGSLARADAMFAWDPQPWCPAIF